MSTIEGLQGNGQDSEVLLEARNLKKYFPVTRGLIVSKVWGWIKAVDGVSFQVRRGDTLGIVGESGCGKSTTAKMLLMLERPTAGSISFRGQDVYRAAEASQREDGGASGGFLQNFNFWNTSQGKGDYRVRGSRYKEYRRSVQAVFQDPWSSLNPRMRVKTLIAEPMVINWKMSLGELRDRVIKLLEDVGLNAYHANLFPHEFSGGQRQRLAIARALALNPDLIVLDEPVSALDVSIRAQIMNLLKDLQSEYSVSYVLIAHNLSTVRYMCRWVAVMYLGQIVELAESRELFDNPLHPYTKALMSAALPYHPDTPQEEIILTGEVPSPLNPPSGCHFHTRCPFAWDKCSVDEPELKEVSSNHFVSCHLY